MSKKIKNIFFLISFVSFIFFLTKYYFSEKNLILTNKSRSSYSLALKKYEDNLPLLENNTNNIITYIDDLVHGVMCVIEEEKAKNQTFNLTFGEARSIGELSEILKNNFPNININYQSKDKFTPDRGTLNIDKAIEMIGYKPENPIELGYVKYINWYKNFWENISK